jgi:serine/threonine-protein kinase
MPLNDAMPGANFPARLQQVMDRALARMPSERYSSAGQFARDAAGALAGVAAAAPDTEGATQIMDAAKTEQIAATRVGGKAGKTAVRTPDTPMPTARIIVPARKKSPVTLVAAVVGLLAVGGGTAYVMSRDDGAPTDSTAASRPPVTADTAPRLAGGNPSGSTANPAEPRSQPTTQPGPTGAGTRTTTTPPASGGTPARAAIDSAAISRELDDALDLVVDEGTRAAARRSLIAQAFQEDNNTTAACRWVGLARGLVSTKPLYAQMAQRLGCP